MTGNLPWGIQGQEEIVIPARQGAQVVPLPVRFTFTFRGFRGCPDRRKDNHERNEIHERRMCAPLSLTRVPPRIRAAAGEVKALGL